MSNIALLIAGGSGVRMHSSVPKQFMEIYGKPVIAYTLEAFQNHPSIDVIGVVCLDGWQERLWQYKEQYGITKLWHVIKGGSTGQESIRNGIYELERHYASGDLVLVHDSIRPMVSEAVISSCIIVARERGNAVTVIPCQEAMLRTDDSISSSISVPRDSLKRSQTPQAFKLGEIAAMHRKAEELGIKGSTASCTLAIELGMPVYFSQGSEKNIKLTTEEDLSIFKALLRIRDGN